MANKLTCPNCAVSLDDQHEFMHTDFMEMSRSAVVHDVSAEGLVLEYVDTNAEKPIGYRFLYCVTCGHDWITRRPIDHRSTVHA